MDWTPVDVKMIITLIVTNLILLVMVGVWGYLSIKAGKAQDISAKFIALGAVCAGPEVVNALILVKDIVAPVAIGLLQ